MRAYEKNPRRLPRKRAKRLREHLERFGDLGGIVVNCDGRVCGGHQRLKVLFGEQGGEFNVRDADIEIVMRHDAPDGQGTLALGFIVWRGFRYAYREVCWDDETFAQANIAANFDGGVWDWSALSQLSAPELLSLGFDPATLLESVAQDFEHLRQFTVSGVPEMFKTPRSPGELDAFGDAESASVQASELPAASGRIGASDIVDDGKKHIIYITLEGEDWVNYQLLKRSLGVSSDGAAFRRMVQLCLNRSLENS